jgi:hypothetical protein
MNALLVGYARCSTDQQDLTLMPMPAHCVHERPGGPAPQRATAGMQYPPHRNKDCSFSIRRSLPASFEPPGSTVASSSTAARWSWSSAPSPGASPGEVGSRLVLHVKVVDDEPSHASAQVSQRGPGRTRPGTGPPPRAGRRPGTARRPVLLSQTRTSATSRPGRRSLGCAPGPRTASSRRPDVAARPVDEHWCPVKQHDAILFDERLRSEGRRRIVQPGRCTRATCATASRNS